MYDYLCQKFPDRKLTPGLVMTDFEIQVRTDIPDVDMSYGFISAQTKAYAAGWIHEVKPLKTYGSTNAYIPKITHTASPMIEAIIGETKDPHTDEELELDDFKEIPGLEIEHYRTGKLIDKMLSTFDPLGGIMSTVNFQVAAEPGVGKTLLTMCMTHDFKKQNPDMNILIVNSEMSKALIQAYIRKSPDLTGVDLLLLRKYKPDELSHILIKMFNKKKWHLIILDSFQDLVQKLQESLDMNLSKIELWLVNLISEMNNTCGTSFLCINHVNKDGSAAGKSFLKHILDGMMEVRRDENDKTQRFVTFSKNRVGLDSVNMYYEILGEGDPRGMKGEVIWDEERYERIHEQKKFLENSKRHVNQELNQFESSRHAMQEAGPGIDQDNFD